MIYVPVLKVHVAPTYFSISVWCNKTINSCKFLTGQYRHIWILHTAMLH